MRRILSWDSVESKSELATMPEISSVAGLRSGIAAFMLGNSFFRGRSALGDPLGSRFYGDLAAGRGFASARPFHRCGRRRVLRFALCEGANEWF